MLPANTRNWFTRSGGMTALTRLRSTMLRWTMRFFLKSSKFSRRPAFSRDLAVAIRRPRSSTASRSAGRGRSRCRRRRACAAGSSWPRPCGRHSACSRPSTPFPRPGRRHPRSPGVGLVRGDHAFDLDNAVLRHGERAATIVQQQVALFTTEAILRAGRQQARQVERLEGARRVDGAVELDHRAVYGRPQVRRLGRVLHADERTVLVVAGRAIGRELGGVPAMPVKTWPVRMSIPPNRLSSSASMIAMFAESLQGEMIV